MNERTKGPTGNQTRKAMNRRKTEGKYTDQYLFGGKRGICYSAVMLSYVLKQTVKRTKKGTIVSVHY